MSPSDLPLETRSLYIRHFHHEDVDRLLALSHEDSLRAWLPSQVYSDTAHAASVLEYLISAYSNAAGPRCGPYVLALEHRTDRALIGHVGFSPMGDDVEIGFAIGQNYQRRGLASEAIVAATRWTLEVFALDKVIAITAVANTASRQALVRSQFAHQGDRLFTFQGTQQMVSVYELSRGSDPALGV